MPGAVNCTLGQWFVSFLLHFVFWFAFLVCPLFMFFVANLRHPPCNVLGVEVFYWKCSVVLPANFHKQGNSFHQGSFSVLSSWGSSYYSLNLHMVSSEAWLLGGLASLSVMYWSFEQMGKCRFILMVSTYDTPSTLLPILWELALLINTSSWKVGNGRVRHTQIWILALFIKCITFHNSLIGSVSSSVKCQLC